MSARSGRTYARLGWLATTFALAVALVVSSLMNYRGAVAAVSTLNRGQADLLESAIREVVRPGGTVSDSDLTLFLEAHREAGLRYVALIREAGAVTASAGEPATSPGLPPRDSAGGDRPLIAVGDRVRAFFPRPPVRGESVERTQGESERQRGGSRSPRRETYHLLEFEPLVASGLVTRATRSVALAAVSATILSLAALLFWRMSGRYEEARQRLEEQRRLTVLGEMSAVLAHEIRNPLASLKGNAQLLAERLPEDSRDRGRAERVVSEATRLEALTSDLLNFARSGPLELAEVDPVQLVRTAVDDVEPGIFEVDAGGSPARWTLDAGRVRQALVNVLQNAKQAGAATRPPLVTIATARGDLVLTIRDFGPGLPTGDEARIFDPFFTTRTNGTGLGLAVARRVAEMHGGRIDASNHPDGGAVFRMVLPPAAL
jgi:two-component system sensor histidine kinase HydH